LKPSHVIFDTSTIKKGLEVLKNTNYISDTSSVRLDEKTLSLFLRKNEVAVFRSFLKARLRFMLHKMLVEVLKMAYIFIS
jgi:hypothetical protein